MLFNGPSCTFILCRRGRVRHSRFSVNTLNALCVRRGLTSFCCRFEICLRYCSCLRRTALPTQNVWPTDFCCGWSVDLELPCALSPSVWLQRWRSQAFTSMSSAVAEMHGRPFGHNKHGLKSVGGLLCPFREELGPNATQCGLGRGRPPYQVASCSIQPFGHNTPTLQGDKQDRKRSDSVGVGRTVLQTVARKRFRFERY